MTWNFVRRFRSAARLVHPAGIAANRLVQPGTLFGPAVFAALMSNWTEVIRWLATRPMLKTMAPRHQPCNSTGPVYVPAWKAAATLVTTAGSVFSQRAIF